jgi:hypothetical protein
VGSLEDGSANEKRGQVRSDSTARNRQHWSQWQRQLEARQNLSVKDGSRHKDRPERPSKEIISSSDQIGRFRCKVTVGINRGRHGNRRR